MKQKILSWTPLSIILILAGFLRLYRIQDYMTFLGDEGRDVLVAWNILHGHLTLLGPTASVGGFFLGPIYYYFMAPFLWLTNFDPVGPAIMVALFGIATVWFVYFLTKKIFNTTAGLIAALLYAVSPLVIAYSRSSWNPNLMPFFSLLVLFFLYKAVQKNELKYFFLSGISLGIAMQLHYLSIFLGVIVGCYMLIATVYDGVVKKLLQRSLLFSLGYLVGWSLFILFEIRHGFENTKSIINFILFSKDTGTGNNFFNTIGNVFFRLFGRLTTDYPPPEQVSLQGHVALSVWFWLTVILGIVSTFFLLQILIKNIKHREKFLQYVLLGIWLSIGVILFGFYKKQIYDYYLAFLFPLPFILIGGLFTWLWTKNTFLKCISIISILSLFAINIQAEPFRYPANKQLQQMEQISHFVISKTNNQPFNFALITGGNSDFAYRYFFTIWGHPPVTIQNYAIDPQRKTVTKQLLIVCEGECHPLGDSLWEVAGFGRAEISGKWQVSVVKVYKLVHYTRK